MIDIKQEKLISLSTAANDLKFRKGKPIACSTVYRWATSGVRGVVLESLQAGGCKVTSEAAIQRFFEALQSTSRPNPPHAKRRTEKQRLKAARAAGRRLASRGA
jgi:Protein of unknown function (DUF1580)